MEAVDQAKRHPIVLVDGGDDGMECEGWVERIVSETKALAIIDSLNVDPDLYTVEVVGVAYLRPDDPTRPCDDDQPWHVCSADALGAVEYWSIQTVDRPCEEDE